MMNVAMLRRQRSPMADLDTSTQTLKCAQAEYGYDKRNERFLLTVGPAGVVSGPSSNSCFKLHSSVNP